ncbi:circularly permuted type 2 ATP-grasp protein [Euzebya tangerina]|uniref:circularly permuted type 2 ATP-grasp protein n=1 Tax=Euzebya tangerina TaxID=591198 RepID=UPI000E310E52|nr:circularly permuted type 2 ATP-grasp protein [Euzebya tangerina]
MLSAYASPECWDELLTPDGRPRPGCERVAEIIQGLGPDIEDRQAAAELAIQAMGITFTVYSEGENIDRAWPFDIIPRVITTEEWSAVSDGLIQRLTALNAFIDDLYNEQRIIDAGVFPREVLESSTNFRPECVGAKPRGGVWAHISGSDLVRDNEGTMYVLEDNLRVPSGVSYMLENRAITKRVLGEAFFDLNIHPVDGYPNALRNTLAGLSPQDGERPVIVVLTPGIYNSAYFEHAFLAQEMGAYLVEGNDLFVDGDVVFMRTVEGPVRVDVIYRRIDDAFLDPEAFRPDSALGVRGLMRAWHAGNVALANAPGAGVADDKVVYAYVPDIIRFYLDADPLIPNVPTFLCSDPDQRSHVLANLDDLVLKPANESGGYGLFIGPRATARQKIEIREQVLADPRNWVAQPTLQLSTAPTLRDGKVVPRHLDLRPFILSGPAPYVTQGGLTRVAFTEGSLVVNSSQGGGSKDTWIIDASSGSQAAQKTL